VPTAGDPRVLRLGLAQIGLASIVAALMLFVAVPREWLGLALLGLIPLAVYMAYRRWLAYQRSMAGSDNVRIDEAGIHWIDAASEDRLFRREDILGFTIGRDADTLRPVPSLTLHLAGGFVSQPIELHLPATPTSVRNLLLDQWKIAEREPPANSDAGDYDVAIAVYGECHDDYQEWHWEGTRDELARFFAVFAAAADELPLPPVGARPAAKKVQATRRQPARLSIAHAPHSHFDPDTIAAPAATLRDISTRAETALADTVDGDDRKFDLTVGPKNVWTFHLHVRSS
jgi:hypothetical protein